jgi:hypothetical protein
MIFRGSSARVVVVRPSGLGSLGRVATGGSWRSSKATDHVAVAAEVILAYGWNHAAALGQAARMDLVVVPGGTFELGWRFTLPSEIRVSSDAARFVDDFITRCSPRRNVALPAFEIAREPVQLADLLGDPYELKDVRTLGRLCDVVDEVLAAQRLSVPSEDELEAAAGGALFPWGMHIPDGIPYGNETSFQAHEKPNNLGLHLLADPYKVELSRTALKFGDGGAAICDAEPWPLAWLALSPSFRLTDEDVSECFVETLEECYVRPVKRG